jgi:hypothetical protein
MEVTETELEELVQSIFAEIGLERKRAALEVSEAAHNAFLSEEP